MIRFLEEKDIPEVEKIEEESYCIVSGEIEDGNEYVMGVFNDDNKLVGFCTCGCADLFGESYYNDVCLSDLYILQSERGKGYGTALVKEVIAHTKEQNARVLLDLLNEYIESFYISFGFKRILNDKNEWNWEMILE